MTLAYRFVYYIHIRRVKNLLIFSFNNFPCMITLQWKLNGKTIYEITSPLSHFKSNSLASVIKETLKGKRSNRGNSVSYKICFGAKKKIVTNHVYFTNIVRNPSVPRCVIHSGNVATSVVVIGQEAFIESAVQGLLKTLRSINVQR